MNGWSADFVNNPNDDYNLTIELIYNDIDVAVISKKNDLPELRLFANKDDITIPVDWISTLLQKAMQSL